MVELFLLLKNIVLIVSVGLSIYLAITQIKSVYEKIVVPTVLVIVGLFIGYPWTPTVVWNYISPSCYNESVGLKINGVVRPVIFNEVHVMGKNERDIDWKFLGSAQAYRNGYFALQIYIHHMGKLRTNSKYFVQQLTENNSYNRGDIVRNPSQWISDKTEFLVQKLCDESPDRTNSDGSRK